MREVRIDPQKFPQVVHGYGLAPDLTMGMGTYIFSAATQ